MQIRHYSLVIWHSLWLVLLGMVICSGATYIISSHAKPVYQASTLIRVNESGGTSSNTSVFSDQALAVGEALLITSPDVLQAAAQKLPGTTSAQLKTMVSAAPVVNTEIIQVLAQANNSQQAANIANTVTTVFIQIQVNKKTAQLQSAMDQLAQQMTVVQKNINSAQAKLDSLQKANASANDIASQNTLLNGYQVNYTSLLTTYQQTQLEKNQAGNILIETQSAIPPDAPTSPHVLLNVEVAAALGLLLMIVLVLLLDWTNNTIKTPDDVAQLAQLEALGSVPLSKQQISSLSPGELAIEQAWARISTNFSAINKDRRAILITSAHSKSGVSITASQLALSLAHSGLRVLLVDAKSQSPSLHEVFQRQNTKGLSNILQDVYVLQEQPGLINSWLNQWTTSIPNLWLMPTGPQSAQSTHILRSQYLRLLVGWLLQQHYTSSSRIASSAVDIVIFDAPALDEGVDTQALATLTDGTVLVIEAAKEKPETLKKISSNLQRLGSPVLGIVINRQKAKHRTYFYVNQALQGIIENGLSNAPAKYALQRIPSSFETPPETPLPIQNRLFHSLSLPHQHDISKQFVPRTPRLLDISGQEQSAQQLTTSYELPDQDGLR